MNRIVISLLVWVVSRVSERSQPAGSGLYLDIERTMAKSTPITNFFCAP